MVDQSSASKIESNASNDKKSEKDLKKSKVQEDQENTQEQMQPLIELLKARTDLEMQYQLTVGLSGF